MTWYTCVGLRDYDSICYLGACSEGYEDAVLAVVVETRKDLRLCVVMFLRLFTASARVYQWPIFPVSIALLDSCAPDPLLTTLIVKTHTSE